LTTTTIPEFGPTCRRGDRIFVTYEGVTASATFITATQGSRNKLVVLDGTEESFYVPWGTITKEHPETGEKPPSAPEGFAI